MEIMCNFITRSNASIKRAVYRSEETRWKLSSLRGLTGINERITRGMVGKLWLEIAESCGVAYRDPGSPRAICLGRTRGCVGNRDTWTSQPHYQRLRR